MACSLASWRSDDSIRAWIVDLDGTLYRQRPVRLAMSAELLLTGWRQVRIVQAFRREHDAVRELVADSEQSPYQLQLSRAAERTGLPVETVAATIEAWMTHRPGKWLRLFSRRRLLEEIQDFHAAGGRTALVSDYPAQTKLAALDLAGLFDTVVANGEPGGPRRMKPAPEGILLAAARLGVEPRECLVIGDRADADGEAARRAGMRFQLVG